ncbi:transmembrane amino acid transporter family protein [Medicago truncatula]|uniref:Transmembrane amino acid transporter family protein n=1 Tax=Medicago truncatula TaxID=3880 RepID=G7K6N0_MEDTR|nr:transmembrane amino acid transporter family protein [Medicago truncatula]
MTGTTRPSHHQIFDIEWEIISQSDSDDDGRLNVLTAISHIITAVIGSGVLSLAWAIAQLGWVAGPAVMILFSLVTAYTYCYRTGDPDSGKRKYTYMDAVRSILGGAKVTFCGIFQYLNLFGIVIGYTIAASISMTAIKKSNCFHQHGDKSPCHMSSNLYMIMFGVIQIFLSQIPDFDQIWWLSSVAAFMSFTYSLIGLALGIAKVAGYIFGPFTGIGIGAVSDTQKIWRISQALGNIAFAYSYAVVLLEIQDTLKSPPSEHLEMLHLEIF